MRPRKQVFCIVSRYNYAGKTHAAKHIANECLVPAAIFEFGLPFWKAAGVFHSGEKDEPNALGITKRDINCAFSDALKKLHPDMPTLQTRLEIEDELDTYESIVILPDIRRPEEFEWVRALDGVQVNVIEVVPTDTRDLQQDTWVTAEVIKIWGEDRFIVANDGSHTFIENVVTHCLNMLENE